MPTRLHALPTSVSFLPCKQCTKENSAIPSVKSRSSCLDHLCVMQEDSEEGCTQNLTSVRPSSGMDCIAWVKDVDRTNCEWGETYEQYARLSSMPTSTDGPVLAQADVGRNYLCQPHSRLSCNRILTSEARCSCVALQKRVAQIPKSHILTSRLDQHDQQTGLATQSRR